MITAQEAHKLSYSKNEALVSIENCIKEAALNGQYNVDIVITEKKHDIGRIVLSLVQLGYMVTYGHNDTFIHISWH